MAASVETRCENKIILGGHRGMGENLWDEAEHCIVPPYRENSVRSFLAAAALGVSFVEFDVQVTSDSVPVVWHDDTVITGDPAAPSERPVADIDLSEFRALVTPQQPATRTSGASAAAPWQTALLRAFRGRVSKAKVAGGLRPWACAADADDALPTLEELFQRLPPSLAFNIEVKLPDSNAGPTMPAEVDRLLGPILEVVDRCHAAGPRDVFFSSFDPDICAALLSRRSRHAVYFLSVAGYKQYSDPRRSSLAAAYQVASPSMAGIAIPVLAVLEHPECVADAAGHPAAAAGQAQAGQAPSSSGAGLKVMTYGLANSDAASVLRQAALGVHAAIVDDVAHVLPQLVPPSATLAVQ